ncbi:MAG: PdxA family protein [Burkholderiaceae bacterium]
MSARTPEEALVVVTIGDPCGVGPEVIVKALADASAPGRVLLVGCADAVRQAVSCTGSALRVRPLQAAGEARFERGCLDVLDAGDLAAADYRLGEPSAAVGRAVVRWWEIATGLAGAGQADAVVKGPVSKEVIRLGLGEVPAEPETFLLLVTGTPLRVAHLSDHVPLSQALARVTATNVLALIRLVHRSLRSWGIASPRIGVAGLNPHAQGREEDEEIGPAVQQARSEGIAVQGPVSPDTIFRQGTDGEYDCIVAHYHDQGHIAVKTWKFDGNCALNLGSPFLRLSVPHGPAFDIAGRGVADSRSMLEALRTAAALGAGCGFPAAN